MDGECGILVAMAHELGIVDLLTVFGFDDRLKSKLVRHQSGAYDMPCLVDEGWFDLYQSMQARPVFHECEQIVSFVGDGSGRARFIGVYRVLGQRPVRKDMMPAKCPYKEWAQSSKYYYDLERRPEFNDLHGRVVIDWGSGALAWHQHLKNKAVIEVFPKGRLLTPFTDYLDFSLSYQELTELARSVGAHQDWVASLSGVAGVYLILAQGSGHQYVGSAYGTEGIWGRWRKYAASGDGGNAKLRALIDSDNAYPLGFRFSVLQVLPKSTAAAEVIRWESQYKAKLGSRATGLNLN